MMYPIVVILIMGLYSHRFCICIKVFMAASGKESCVLKMLKQVFSMLYTYRAVARSSQLVRSGLTLSTI